MQKEAAKKNCVFFLDCGQGDLFENEAFECEDLCGWMIPEALVDEFTPLFMDGSEDQHGFDDHYVFVDFNVNGDVVEILIDDSPNDLIVEFNLADEIEKANQ